MTGPLVPNRATPTGEADALSPVRGNAVEVRLRAHRRALAEWLRSPTLARDPVVLTELTELASELLGGACASVWLHRDDGAALECVDTFVATTHAHLSGMTLRVAECPRYLAALEEGTLAVVDAQADPRMSELHLAARDVHALLASPVLVRGALAGVVCVEHAGEARAWQLWEALVLGTLADSVSLLLSARAEHASERACEALRAQVDELLGSRTSQVVRENADLQREVDALQLAAAAIRKSEDDLRQLFAACPVPLLLLRRSDERVLLINEVAASSLRAQGDEMREQPASELFAHRSDVVDLLGAIARTGRDEAREVQLRARDGEAFWALVSARSVSFGAIETVMIGFSDLTAQKAVEHQLRFLAQRDPLTQAYNRHHFWQLASVEMARVTRYRRPLSIAMIDADHFKRVNDEYGHDVGDQVLRMLVDTCHESLRKNDVLARYGGEELIVLLPETPPDSALAVVERLRERIAQTPLVLEDGRHVSVTVSIGLAGLESPQEGLEQLLKRADDALYTAKRRGRNCVEVAPSARV